MEGAWPVVASDNDLKRGVIQLFHNNPAARHLGIANTYALTKRDFWWPSMRQDIEQYVNVTKRRVNAYYTVITNDSK